jgi:hypothetical protein
MSSSRIVYVAPQSFSGRGSCELSAFSSPYTFHSLRAYRPRRGPICAEGSEGLESLHFQTRTSGEGNIRSALDLEHLRWITNHCRI